MMGKAQAGGGSRKTGTVYLHHSWEDYGIYKIKKREISRAILRKTRLLSRMFLRSWLAVQSADSGGSAPGVGEGN